MTNILVRFRCFFDESPYYQIRVFKFCLYMWVQLNTFVLSFKAEHFWGKYSFKSALNFDSLNLIGKSINLLNLENVQPYYPVFIVFQVSFCILAMGKRIPWFSSIMVLLITLNLDNKVATTLDGGNNIIHLMLFYSVFMLPQRGTQNKLYSSLKHYSSKFSFLMAQIQLCLVYFVAGHLKVSGNLWPNGTALYYTFNIDEYSHPFLQELITSLPIISVLGSYLTLGFQLSFPFLIWFQELRPILFLVGTCIHLGISFGMGLVSFGFAMIVCYTLFYSPRKAKKIYSWLFRNNTNRSKL